MFLRPATKKKEKKKEPDESSLSSDLAGSFEGKVFPLLHQKRGEERREPSPRQRKKRGKGLKRPTNSKRTPLRHTASPAKKKGGEKPHHFFNREKKKKGSLAGREKEPMPDLC